MATYRRRNNRWCAQVRKDSKTISKTFTLKIDAIRWAKETEIKLQQSSFVNYGSNKTKLSELLDKYENEVVPTLKSHKSDRCRIKAIKPILGSLMLSELSPVLLAEYRNKRLENLSPQSVKHELSMINRTLLKATEEWGYSFPNGIPKAKYPALPTGRDRRLTKDEEERLLSYCDPYLIDIIKVLQNTAMRIGELVKLTKDDINFEKRLAVLSDTKNGDDRLVPLNSTAISSLTSIIQQSKDTRLLSLRYSCISHRFTSACRKSGIEDYRLHDLRHEAISRLFERGFSIMEVSTISGHRSLASLKRYTHINPTSLLDRMG